jgi:hypothetical protein
MVQECTMSVSVITVSAFSPPSKMKRRKVAASVATIEQLVLLVEMEVINVNFKI